MNICTIIARNYVAHARVLAESFSRAHPEGSCAVLVIDDHAGLLDPAREPFELIELDQIGLPDPERMAASYDVTELSTAVKPWLLRHLLARDGVDEVAYLDPDIVIADSIAAIGELALAHGIVLTPHFTRPLPRDGRRPSEEDILIAGAFNLGFVALADTPASAELLDWWSQRLERHCIVDPANGLFVDQRWIDLVPGIWPGAHVHRDPGCNVAYWNLPTRRLEIAGDGYLVDGEPLRFFHFSGFDPTSPSVLSKHQDRVDVASDPALSRICGEYAGQLLAHGFEEARAWPYGWGTLPGGVRLDRAARLVHRQASEDGAASRVFEQRGAERFLAFLNEVPPGSGVSRYGRALRDSREDLRLAFPDVEGRDAAPFEQWLLESAESLEIPSPLLPRREQGGHERLGVNLAGYLGSELGVGEAARGVAAALAAAELPGAAIEIPVEEAELSAALGGLEPERFPHDVNLICVNADMLPSVARAAPPALFEGRHTAGLWFWEVERFPERWRDSFEYLDEVWTASEFVAGALRPHAPVPVSTIRIPVDPVDPGAISRERLSMPDGFCFLFVFDHRSVFRRKNPLGLIEAFRRAFEPGSGASLMLKTVGADSRPEQVAELAAAAAEHPDVHLFDGVVSAAAKNAMIASCDCFVSLHRSEGLGLTMAEAMYFGKPVIATGYSGNLDFMTAENSFLVDHELVPIGAGSAPYPADARWAEPDLEQAAALMRAAFEDPGRAAAIGRRAAASIRATHSPAAAGELLERRLTAIRRQRVVGRLNVPVRATASTAPASAPPVVSAPTALAVSEPVSARGKLAYLLRFEQVPARPGAGRARRFLKGLYMRLLRPYASHQRRIDLSLRDAVVEIGAELAGLEQRLAAADGKRAGELGQRAEELERRLQALDGDVRGACAVQAEELDGAAERLAELERSRLERPDLAPLEAELARERTLVDQLRSRIDRLSGQTEDALETLRGGAEEMDRLTRAGAAKPYMADERFGAHEDPSLGSVIGFENHSPNGEPRGYRGFEELFRGPESMIRERQRPYLRLVEGRAPVLDAGCGRGEFLELLGAAGIEAHGVDLDPDMVAHCREKGLAVERADLLDAIAAAPPRSLGCVFSAQVIEHLDAEALRRFFALAAACLRGGGKLVVETVNPHCAEALKAFWVDPTHQRPLFPEAVLALCQLAGFESAHAFCPLGSGDWEADRLVEGEYAVVATVPG